VSQVRVSHHDFLAYIDLAIKGVLVGIEFDGELKYRSPVDNKVTQTVMNEKRRHGLLESFGWRLVRVIWEQLKDPERLDRRLVYAGATK
jgi:hypothetical protein